MPGRAHFKVWSLLRSCFRTPADGTRTVATNTTSSQHEKTEDMSESKYVESPELKEAATEAKDRAQDVVQAMSRLKRVSHRWTLVETQKASERQSYTDKRRFVEESILERADELASRATGDQDSALQEQLRSDSQALRAQSASLMELEKKSTSLATQLVDASTVSWNALKALVQTVPGGQAMLEEIERSPPDVNSRRTSTSSAIPTAAREYFNAVAEKSLLQESMAELETHQQEERQAREAAKEQDREVEQSDDEFEKSQLQQHGQMLAKLQDAEVLVETLYSKCREANIDVELLQYRGAGENEYALVTRADALHLQGQIDSPFLPIESGEVLYDLLDPFNSSPQILQQGFRVSTGPTSDEGIQTWLMGTSVGDNEEMPSDSRDNVVDQHSPSLRTLEATEPELAPTSATILEVHEPPQVQTDD